MRHAGPSGATASGRSQSGELAPRLEPTIRARALVNAAGPWVEKVLTETVGATAKARIRLVQGSHIVVPRLFEHDRAYMLQNPDGRIVFAIPYLDDYTLVGTTDRDFSGDPETVQATDEEVAYLCEVVNRNFAKPISPRDVAWRFSGLRPLYDDGASEAKAATRDYVFELDASDGGAALLSIFGGKITTYRRLAEQALERLRPFLPPDAARTSAAKAGWTATAPLPGGDFAVDGVARLEARLAAQFPFLTQRQVRRLVRSLRHACVGRIGRRPQNRRPRPGFRRGPDGGGGAISRGRGMGALCGRYRLAPFETRHSTFHHGNRRYRALDSRDNSGLRP